MWFKYILVSLFAFFLISCSDEQGDDLDKFIRDASSKEGAKIKSLPDVKPYLALQYNADDILNDPFHPRKAASKSGALQPNLNRPKEPMEAYPLESLKYVGMLSKNKLTYALLKTPDNNVQQVKVGNFVGQNYGVVTQITENEISLKEIVQDDMSGDWIERVTTVALQE